MTESNEQQSSPDQQSPVKCQYPRPRELAGFERSYLRGLAHHVKPVVQVGQAGVTGQVTDAVDAALLDHELIKARMIRPADKKAMAAELAERAFANLCGVVGHVAILYRPHPDSPRIKLPTRPEPADPADGDG